MLRGLVIGIALLTIAVSWLLYFDSEHKYGVIGGPILIASSLITLAICATQPGPKP